MRRLNQTPKDLRVFSCPQCGKQRMSRPFEHIVSTEQREFTDKSGTKINLHIDICNFCQVKNFHKHFEPTQADVKRILKSMKDESKLSGEQSLEELL